VPITINAKPFRTRRAGDEGKKDVPTSYIWRGVPLAALVPSMVMGDLQGRRVLVVGASKGLGRAIAVRLDQEGAAISVAGRTTALLESLAEECGGRPHVISCDARDPSDCEMTVERTVAVLGGLDALVFTPGTTVVTELQHAEPEHWRSVFETNVFAAGNMTRAAIPHLEATKGTAIYFSSVSAHLTPPWIGMGLYAASKVALEKSVEVWKLEHADVRFTTIVVGSTAGGEFFRDATIPDEEDLERFSAQWRARGYLPDQQLQPEDQAKAVIDVLTSTAEVDVIWVRPQRLLQLPAP
jgi:NAD(P)-dependent dehydrogenase (short-subunit alcohol dehydrogenase family)